MTTLEFLKRFHPDTAWQLTAIAPNRKGIETRSFAPGDEAVEWITAQDGQRNCYFNVNPVIDADDKKASKTNVLEVRWLHVDVDAGPGDLLAELDRIKALVTTGLPPGVPKPTAVVYSGGGYQAFWRLKEPIPINGDLAAAKQAERYNKQLELMFGGDSCHNVDRIMRLPGTMNIPNQQKVAKGRVPVRAEVLYFDDSSYALSEFQMAADTNLGTPGSTEVEVSGNIPRLGGVDDLDEWDVPDRVKVIIVQGFHPDEPKEGDDSRSAWLFDVVCNLKRAAVPDEIVYSVITDPNFKIADSVREASDPHKYALKQIKSAKEHIESEWLHHLNQRFAVIGNWGGKCRVAEEVYDEVMDRYRLVKQSFEDFRNRYCNQFETVAVKNAKGDTQVREVPVGKWWLAHPQRREYDRLVFAPGQDLPDAYNLWRGFGCNAIPGDAHRPFLEHALNVICRGNREHFDYLVGWMARAVQNPSTPGETAVVMRGRQGTGKSFLAKHFGRLFGRHFLHVSNAAHLVGNFNSHLRDAILVFGDEAFYAGDKRHESVLKTLITEESLMIEAKGVDAEVSPNYTHLMLASNSDWVVPVDADDRRFFVLDVSDEHQKDTVYFAGLQDSLEDGGYESLLSYLLNYDLSNFSVQDVPQTDALADQKTMTMEPHEEWWMEVLQQGAFGEYGEVWSSTTRITNPALYQSYIDSTARAPAHRVINRNRLAHYLRKVCPRIKSCRISHDGRVARGVELPTLQQARADWDTAYGTAGAWDVPLEEAENDDNLPF